MLSGQAEYRSSGALPRALAQARCLIWQAQVHALPLKTESSPLFDEEQETYLHWDFQLLSDKSSTSWLPLESQPGDVVAFNHNLMHASFGGSTQRRMFTLNNCARCTSAAEIEDLENYVAAHARFWLDHMHSDVMRQTAPPARMVHLQQVMEHEAHLSALSAKARQEMAESSRG